MSKQVTIRGNWALAFTVFLVWGAVDALRDVAHFVVWVFG